MTGPGPADLDQRRHAASLMGVETRRRALEGLEVDRERRRDRDADLHAHVIAGPSETWPEAAAKAIYLLRLLAPRPEAQDSWIARLLERAVIDLDWLSRQQASGAPGNQTRATRARHEGEPGGSSGFGPCKRRPDEGGDPA